MDSITVQFQRFISAEAAQIADGNAPVVVLSFGDEESPITDFALVLPDARELVVHVLWSLAQHGDELAQHILDMHFSE